MNVLSLFDGISCGQIALGRLGVKINNYFSSEIDKYAIQITQKNYPNTKQLGDIYTIDYSKLPNIDLVVGGSPCTHWSIAKKDRETTSSGVGFDLFLQYVKAIKETNCKHFLYENNYSIHKDIQDAISKELGVEPIMINSALLSGQQRKRLYWTNIPNVTIPIDKNILLQDILEEGITERSKSFCIDASYYKGGNLKSHFEKHRRTQIFQPIRLGQIGKGGQGQRIYSIEGKSINLTANGGGQGAKTGLYKIDLPNGEYFIRKLTPIECERLQTVPEDFTKQGLNIKGEIVEISNTQRYKALGNGWTVDVIAHILRNIKC